jgi:cytochrome bd-type quinol oxidase subunit 2
MDATALLLSRIQFAFTISFHIIFPAFTIGLAAWLTLLETFTAFMLLALSFWPHMVPFAITIDEAAAPHSSLAFMFWGEGLFVFPLMLIYVATGFRVFRGKFE